MTSESLYKWVLLEARLPIDEVCRPASVTTDAHYPVTYDANVVAEANLGILIMDAILLGTRISTLENHLRQCEARMSDWSASDRAEALRFRVQHGHCLVRSIRGMCRSTKLGPDDMGIEAMGADVLDRLGIRELAHYCTPFPDNVRLVDLPYEEWEIEGWPAPPTWQALKNELNKKESEDGK